MNPILFGVHIERVTRYTNNGLSKSRRRNFVTTQKTKTCTYSISLTKKRRVCSRSKANSIRYYVYKSYSRTTANKIVDDSSTQWTRKKLLQKIERDILCVYK